LRPASCLFRTPMRRVPPRAYALPATPGSDPTCLRVRPCGFLFRPGQSVAQFAGTRYARLFRPEIGQFANLQHTVAESQAINAAPNVATSPAPSWRSGNRTPAWMSDSPHGGERRRVGKDHAQTKSCQLVRRGGRCGRVVRCGRSIFMSPSTINLYPLPWHSSHDMP
jgi:hypothetical protein